MNLKNLCALLLDHRPLIVVSEILETNDRPIELSEIGPVLACSFWKLPSWL